MGTYSFPHFTLIFFFFISSSLFIIFPSPIFSLNITSILSTFPDLSDFNNLLINTSVAQDLTQRSSVTLLVVPNKFLRSSSDLTHHSNIADVLRYHVLLQYLSWPELRQIPVTGKLITTLYQTTGRANSNLGSVNITRNPIDGTIYVRSPVSYSPLNVTLISLIKTLPYNVSIFTVNSLLIPYGFDLMASENRPPLGLNITKHLLDGHNFNVAASMLMASGVSDEFERDEGGAGITIFVPTDDAFSDLPITERLQSLPADSKAVILKFHVLHSYYPLGSLESIVNPVQPTLATEDIGAGRFTLNISRANGSVIIDSGLVQASITQTVFDENPVAIFAVSRVLLPREIFGRGGLLPPPPTTMNQNNYGAQPPQVSLSPDNNSPAGLESPSSTHLSSSSSPTGFSDNGKSSKVINGRTRFSFIFSTICIGLYLIL